jgi:hypothetical protein
MNITHKHLLHNTSQINMSSYNYGEILSFYGWDCLSLYNNNFSQTLYYKVIF